jgi:hypothetical protein
MALYGTAGKPVPVFIRLILKTLDGIRFPFTQSYHYDYISSSSFRVPTVYTLPNFDQ